MDNNNLNETNNNQNINTVGIQDNIPNNNTNESIVQNTSSVVNNINNNLQVTQPVNEVNTIKKPKSKLPIIISIVIVGIILIVVIAIICITSLITKNKYNLFNIIKSQAKSDTIDFSINSMISGTNGVYITTETDSGNPVYYYRGSYKVLKNNIIFNDICWKIIRTTETGGVKLIYNGNPKDGKCETQTGSTTQVGKSAFNINYNDNAYVGYMYGTAGSTTYEATHANTNNSTIKTYIDDWYSTNFTDANVISKLEDTVFCNDRSTVAGGNNNSSNFGTKGFGTNATGYGALARASLDTYIPSPSLKCTNATDKFTVNTSIGNGKLTNPVGLITLDEVVFAGFNTYESDNSNYENTTNYLYTNSSYWTFSPVGVYMDGNAAVGSVDFPGVFFNYNVSSNTIGVRPVVSLAEGTLVTTDGDGSTTNPYVVK